MHPRLQDSFVYCFIKMQCLFFLLTPAIVKQTTVIMGQSISQLVFWHFNDLLQTLRTAISTYREHKSSWGTHEAGHVKRLHMGPCCGAIWTNLPVGLHRSTLCPVKEGSTSSVSLKIFSSSSFHEQKDVRKTLYIHGTMEADRLYTLHCSGQPYGPCCRGWFVSKDVMQCQLQMNDSFEE